MREDEYFDMGEDETHDPPQCDCGGLLVDMEWDADKRKWKCENCGP